ncbi:MAG: YaaA family protein [Desulfopila sp.]
MLILLSPSKTQEPEHTCAETTLPEFQDRAMTLANKLQKLNTDEIGQLMQVSAKLAQTTRQRFVRFTSCPAPSNCSPALLAFRGDVFAEMDVDNYTLEDFHFAQNHLRILSGLYGILRPLDLIQPHRLEMASRFRPMENSNASLYNYWCEPVTSSLTATLAGHDPAEVLNLASDEYFKVIASNKLAGKVVKVFFKEHTGEKLRTVAIHAKKARGALVHHIISNRLSSSSALHAFSHNGYVFDRGMSNDNNLYFIKR